MSANRVLFSACYSLEVARRAFRLRPIVVLAVLAICAAAAGTVLGFGLQFDLPDVDALERYTPALNTRVLARDGTPLASFGEQRRTLLEYGDIPKVFEQAVIAVEDADFYTHNGIDLKGILRAAWHDLTTLSLQQGASTITQQLSRNLFLKPEKTARRKVQEMLLAIEIERSYSKQEILRMYANQVYMGHGRYGLEAATQFYFGRRARDLTLPEAALLAGLIQRPEALSPLRSMDRAVKRREHVLRRMVVEGFIGTEEANRAAAEPVVLNTRSEDARLAPYFVEQVRRWLRERFGEEGLYEKGLQVKTTLDPRYQALANRAVDLGLRELDKRQGWRGTTVRVPPDANPETWEPDSWAQGVREGDVADGVVLSTRPGRAEIRVGPWRGALDAETVAWTGKSNPAALVRRGDVIRVRIVRVSPHGHVLLDLEQEPAVEAGLVALEPATGDVLALVGGFDFRRSEFDRAIQARRQAGSSFKPFVYAAAMEGGAGPADLLLDEPTVFVEPGTWKAYQPENYGRRYLGEITLRTALEKSANIATVKLLDRVGYPAVIEMARRLGVTTELRPFPSMALGAFEVSLIELTSAYSAFANQGVRVEPHLVDQVLGRDRVPIYTSQPLVHEAVRPEIAYEMNRLLEGVITDGTGAAAASLGRPLAGKTGTTDDFTDAWFVGYSPRLAVGVWVGFDLKKTLGSRESGAQAALPIWKAFMEAALEGEPPEEFTQPPGVSLVAVDRATGLRANDAAGCSPVIVEAFVAGTEPTSLCTLEAHERLRLPYPFHRYPIGADGTLEIPAAELEMLLATEPTVRLVWNRLESWTAEGPVSMPVRLTGEPTPNAPVELDGRVDPPPVPGADGRLPRIVILGKGLTYAPVDQAER